MSKLRVYKPLFKIWLLNTLFAFVALQAFFAVELLVLRAQYGYKAAMLVDVLFLRMAIAMTISTVFLVSLYAIIYTYEPKNNTKMTIMAGRAKLVKAFIYDQLAKSELGPWYSSNIGNSIELKKTYEAIGDDDLLLLMVKKGHVNISALQDFLVDMNVLSSKINNSSFSQSLSEEENIYFNQLKKYIQNDEFFAKIFDKSGAHKVIYHYNIFHLLLMQSITCVATNHPEKMAVNCKVFAGMFSKYQDWLKGEKIKSNSRVWQYLNDQFGLTSQYMPALLGQCKKGPSKVGRTEKTNIILPAMLILSKELERRMFEAYDFGYSKEKIAALTSARYLMVALILCAIFIVYYYLCERKVDREFHDFVNEYFLDKVNDAEFMFSFDGRDKYKFLSGLANAFPDGVTRSSNELEVLMNSLSNQAELPSRQDKKSLDDVIGESPSHLMNLVSFFKAVSQQKNPVENRWAY